jgi:hypothetical protein
MLSSCANITLDFYELLNLVYQQHLLLWRTVLFDKTCYRCPELSFFKMAEVHNPYTKRNVKGDSGIAVLSLSQNTFYIAAGRHSSFY